MSKDFEKLWEVVNKLSNEDLCHLINMVSERLSVFVGVVDNKIIEDRVLWASLNGATVQINLHSCELGDLRQNEEWAWALNGKVLDECDPEAAPVKH